MILLGTSISLLSLAAGFVIGAICEGWRIEREILSMDEVVQLKKRAAEDV